MHPALSVLRQYREEKAKAAARRDTEALENARLFLLQLGDVILPEEYVEAKLKIARQSLTTVENLRAIKEAALSSSDLNKLLIDKLESAGMESVTALEAVLRTRRKYPKESEASTLLALASNEGSRLVAAAKPSADDFKAKRVPTVNGSLQLLDAVRSGEAEGLTPSQALLRVGKVLSLSSLRDVAL